MSEIQKRSDQSEIQINPKLTPYPDEVRKVQEYAVAEGQPVYAIAKGWLKQYGQRPASYNRYVKAIKKILDIELDVVTAPQERAARQRVRAELKQIREARRSVEDRVPSTKEVYELAAAAPTHLGLLIEFLFESGARISEALDVELRRIEEVPKSQTTICRVVGKGKEDRVLHCPTELLDRIRAAFGGARWLFEHRGGQYSAVAMTNRIAELAHRVLGKPYRAHSLRHAAAIRMRDSGLPREKVQEFLGHKSADTTDIYFRPQFTTEDYESLKRPRRKPRRS